ncbi:MAG TPA: C4-type zinc ribbon domain-containing protein [Candidatus Methylomirabilis sp.]|nr:C4-type zinc ribbon domain-containing protein [Candidatus Methylomirabilis sp.]
MDAQLRTLIDLQALDTRIAGLEGDLTRLPRELDAVHASVDEAKKAVEEAKVRLETARKNQRAKEKDLDDNRLKRQKYEGQLYQVKTNKEYSAVLAEIEDVKQEKARIEEEILGWMEQQERAAADVKDAEGRFKAREADGRSEEAHLAEKIRSAQADLGLVRSERAQVAKELPPSVLVDYDRILRHRGVAIVEVTKPNFCGGCHVTMTPQRLQELRQQNTLIHCESCGRYLYWVA